MDIGGQAVIEGVMMRNKQHVAVAVRLKNGAIRVKKEKSSLSPSIFTIPFLRGVVGLGYALSDGIKALIWSSNQQLQKKERITPREVALTLIISLLFGIVFFVGVPFFSAYLIHSEGVLFNVLDGLFRVALFLGYLWFISTFKDIKTLFQYHGAEHKSIACYEAGKILAVKNARSCSRFHPRCGTSFIFIILLLSIVLFSVLTGPWWIKLGGRILFLPLIAAVGYEILKLSNKYRRNVLIKAFIAPGLWLQRITTKEPNNKQLEVGLRALKEVLD